MAAFIGTPQAFDVVSRACRLQGLPLPQGTVLGSDDVTFQQMAETLSQLGLDLIEDYIWPQQVREVELALPDTSGPSIVLDLPQDFDRWIDDTGWNDSARWPLLGPVHEQGWQAFSQFVAGSTMFRVMWRSAGPGKAEIKPLNAGQTMALRYVSRAWVRDAVDEAAWRDHIEKDTDLLYFDSQLLTLGLVYKWRERKGFDISAEKRDYEYRRDKRLGDTRGAPSLSITTRGTNSYLITNGNVSDTGYGH